MPGGLTFEMDNSQSVAQLARSADGTTVTFAHPDGRGGRLDADRTFTMTRGSGLSRQEKVFHLDGTTTLRDGTALCLVRAADGSITGSDVRGRSVTGTTSANGDWVVPMCDESTRTYYDDLSVDVVPAATLAVEPSTTMVPQGGLVRQVQGDGNMQFVLPDATVVTITVDATTLAETVTASDGSPVTLLADGTWRLTRADGHHGQPHCGHL